MNGHKKRRNRIAALILSAVMLVNNSVFAYSAEALTEQSQISEAQQEQVSTPETSAPETSAPETSAPETSAPETNAPETSAPETSAPETSAPETSAPETSVPETSVPETGITKTEMPETETMQTGETETEIPETTEEAAEASTEKDFCYTEVLEGIEISVSAKAGVLPGNAQIRIRKIPEEEVQPALAKILSEEGKEAAELRFYEMKVFDQNGTEIHPNGKVELSISGTPLFADTTTSENRIYDFDQEQQELLQIREHFVINQNEAIYQTDLKNAAGVVGVKDVQPETETEVSPEFQYEQIFEEHTVALHAAAGVLPEGTAAVIVQVEFEDAAEYIEEMMDDKVLADAVTYDINLFDADRNKIQPNGIVEVTINDITAAEETEMLNAYRIDPETGEVTVLAENLDLEAGSYTVGSDHFTYISLASFVTPDMSEVSALALSQFQPGKYEAETYTQDVYKRALAVNNGGWVVAYCFNGAQKWPVYSNTYQMIKDATAEDMAHYSVAGSRSVRGNVLKVIYNGYPYNTSGLWQKYGLSAGQFQAVTQAAIWLYTDNIDYNHSAPKTECTWTKDMTDAYNTLIGGAVVTPPSNFELDLFISKHNREANLPYDERSQNLLATRMGKIIEAPQFTEVRGEKIWEDDFDADGLRPESVEIVLYANNSVKETLTITEEDNWEYEFTNLPITENGKKIIYRVDERNVPSGYTKTVDGMDITNTHIPENVNVEGIKKWQDNRDQDGKRPESIEVILKANGIEEGRKTVTEADNWQYRFEDLPKYKDGKLITYKIEEEPVEGYRVSTEGYNLINTYTPGKVSVKVNKVWKDAEDQDGKRAREVTIHLYADGQDTEKSLTLNEGNQWQGSFDDLAEYKAGKLIKYTVTEDEVNGYSCVIAENGNSYSYTATNSHTPETVELKGVKKWNDQNELNRPEKITVLLYAGDKEVDRKDVAATDNWTWSFVGKPKYENGKEIKYSVKENDVDRYDAVYEIKEDGTVEITNTTHELIFSKRDVLGEELPGASVEIQDHEGRVVEKWTSTEKARIVNLKAGAYVFKEIAVPSEGYLIATDIKFRIDTDGNVTAEGDAIIEGNDNHIIVMVDAYKDQIVKVSKTDIGGEEIEGAELIITDKEGTEVDKWTSKAKETHESTLQPGEYTLTEKTAPKGYEVAESIKFSVDKESKVKVYNEETQQYEETDKVTMVDAYKDQIVKVSKTDIGGEEIEGAELIITDKEGTEVDKWTSKAKETHESTLQPGEYTLTEKTAPKGYEVAESIKFSVDKESKVKVYNEETQQYEETDKVTMVDAYKDQIVKVSKTDIGGEEIEGAELIITDKEGTEVDKWISKAKETHESTLQPGEYTLTEKTAPKGYEVAESIKFSVDKESKVKVYNEETQQYEETDKITMVDAYKDQIVKVSKTDIGGEEIEGAELIITDKEGTEVDKWTSKAKETHESTLQPGEYTLTEKTAPKGYEVAESIKFSVDKDSKVKVYNEETQQYEETDKVTMVDAYSDHKVLFSKRNLAGEELAGATIQLLESDGKTVIETWISDGTVKEFSLQPGTYQFKETAAPEKYAIAATITFRIGTDGTITAENAILEGETENLIVMVDGYLDKEYYKETEKPKKEETEKTSKTTTSTSSNNQSGGGTSVKTGDSTPIMLYLGMGLIAGVLAAAVFAWKKKKKC